MQPIQPHADRARYIRTILAHHDHTQADLGKLLGITQQAAGRKLRGLRRFDVDDLVLIADYYGVDIERLIRPPDLTGVLGCVPAPARDLLTCTKYQVRLFDDMRISRYGNSANPGVFAALAAA